MHTVALSNEGKVYTWGCNDEGALGRTGVENVPHIVDEALAIPITDVSAGDSHSVAYNTELNQIFFWGGYRVRICFRIQINTNRMQHLASKQVALRFQRELEKLYFVIQERPMFKE
jgi:alpha-tubulin suppressor-like RCC1 family protein